MDLPLSQEFPTIDFPESGGSFSYILGSDGNQSDVDGNRLMQNLDRAGHLQQINNLLAPSFDTSPGPTAIEPSLRDFAGSIEFDINVNSLFQEEKKKASWLCSHKLKKLFIKMDAPLKLQFSWKHTVIPLFIRATPVYTSPDYAKVAVERCPTHRQAEIDKNGESPIVEHVLRCANDSAFYEKDPMSGRYSVKVPVKRSEEKLENFNVDVDYFFTCQTSCTSGMERRPIQVLFTVEDIHGNVCGRRIWGFKICACPRRDMTKELLDKEWTEDAESHDGKKRIQETQTKKSISSTLSVDEKLTKGFSDLINVIPEENLALVKSLLTGRFCNFMYHPNEDVREAFMPLLQ